MSSRRVLLGAAITLSATLVGALTACIILVVKQQRGPFHPSPPVGLSGGQRMALIVTGPSMKGWGQLEGAYDKYVVRYGSANGGKVPGGWRTVEVPRRTSPWVVKWLTPFVMRGYSTVVVADSGSFRKVQQYMRAYMSGAAPTSALAYTQPVSSPHLLQFVGEQKKLVSWAGFLRENVHPAWWLSVLVPDLSVVVHKQNARSAEAVAKCEVMLRLMHAHQLPDDRLVFGYIFSPLSTLAMAW